MKMGNGISTKRVSKLMHLLGTTSIPRRCHPYKQLSCETYILYKPHKHRQTSDGNAAAHCCHNRPRIEQLIKIVVGLFHCQTKTCRKSQVFQSREDSVRLDSRSMELSLLYLKCHCYFCYCWRVVRWWWLHWSSGYNDWTEQKGWKFICVISLFNKLRTTLTMQFDVDPADHSQKV